MDAVAGRNVLEIAAGTGYWTQFAAQTAKKIVATDLRQEVMRVARETKSFISPVEFVQADAFKLPFREQAFDAGLANFWFSHLKKSERVSFLDGFHRVLAPGSTIFMADNVYNEGVGGELVTKPGDEDTYKLRKLKDGRESLVLKNYPTPDELQELFSNYDPEFNQEDIYFGEHFWYTTYTLPSIS